MKINKRELSVCQRDELKFDNTFKIYLLQRSFMEYRKATIEEAQAVCDIVQETKARIYPHYYTQAVVDFLEDYTVLIILNRILHKEESVS